MQNWAIGAVSETLYPKKRAIVGITTSPPPIPPAIDKACINASVISPKIAILLNWESSTLWQ